MGEGGERSTENRRGKRRKMEENKRRGKKRSKERREGEERKGNHQFVVTIEIIQNTVDPKGSHTDGFN